MKKTKVAVYHGNSGISGIGVASALKKSKIRYSMITAEEIGSGGLDKFKAVVFPGGGGIALDKEQNEMVLSYIKKGGGMVGVCAGAQYGYAKKILSVEHKIFRATGIFDMRIIKKHPVTKGYVVAPKSKSREKWRYSPEGRVRIRYCNGGLFIVKGKAEMLVSFDEENMYGAVVAGKYGKGKVVLITPHPESTPPVSGYNEFKLQEPLKLFENAVKYVMKS